MRAKEYLEIYKKKIYYFQVVKKAIQGLYPLRCNKRKTEEYFNKYLFADARYRSFIADNDENDKDDEFTEKEGEVDRQLHIRLESNYLTLSQETTHSFTLIILSGLEQIVTVRITGLWPVS